MGNFNIGAFRTALLRDDPLVRDVWNDKYRLKFPDGSSQEANVADTHERVVNGVYKLDTVDWERHRALVLVSEGILIPAGRVNAGAGSGRNVTMINCFVSDTVHDSMPGIQWCIARGALTMQQGGGLGTDYSTVRPAGAMVGRTGAVASGVIPFADQQSGMGDTIQSAGYRRAAQMLCLSIDHPDVWNPDQYNTGTHPATGDTILTSPSFISAKRQKGRLLGFNMSVLATDAFIRALDEDANWDLGFHIPRADGNHVDVYDKPFAYDYVSLDNEFQVKEPQPAHRDFRKGRMLPWYVYRRVPARQLWDDLMRATYKYAEPGVIFIDRVNQRNNLYYCEDIRATNPCGEQPLPPSGACCLGSVNTAFLVEQPFTPQAYFNMAGFRNAVKCGVRMLDNVLAVTQYPLAAQRDESMNKRRIGLGITGWHDALIQLGFHYDSPAAIELAKMVGHELFVQSYGASADLAGERGVFPYWEKDKFMDGYNVKRLPVALQNKIAQTGLRNGVLNTIAPNGTISIYAGNVSSGHEPHFSFQPVQRKVKQPDGTAKSYKSVPYSYRLYEAMFGETPVHKLPDTFVGALDLSVDGHVAMHATWQEYIDASISKTINCPPDMTFDDFKGVYRNAYNLGCKGVTTYRPDPDSGRGSVLSVDEPVVTSNDDIEWGVAETMEEVERERAKLLADDKPAVTTYMTENGPMDFTLQKVGLYDPDEEDVEARQKFEAYSAYALATTREEKQTALERLIEMGEVCITHPKPQEDTEEDDQVFTTDTPVPDEDPEHPIATPITPTIPTPKPVDIMPAQRVVEARRYKLTWPQTGANWYITITRVGCTPFEIFITTKDAAHAEWVTALSRLLTAILRRGGDVKFLINELAEIHSASGGAFIRDQHRYRPSVIAAIGGVIEEEFRALGMFGATDAEVAATAPREIEAGARVVPVTVTRGHGADSCPQCGSTPLVREQGCERCLSCDYNRCS